MTLSYWQESRADPAPQTHRSSGGGPARAGGVLRHARRQAQETAKARAAAARRRAVQNVMREARKKTRKRNARLEARQIHPGARMDAGAERDVAVGVAREVEPLRIRELRGIAVRRADA